MWWCVECLQRLMLKDWHQVTKSDILTLASSDSSCISIG